MQAPMARCGRQRSALVDSSRRSGPNPLHPPYYDAALGTALSLAPRYVEQPEVFRHRLRGSALNADGSR